MTLCFFQLFFKRQFGFGRREEKLRNTDSAESSYFQFAVSLLVPRLFTTFIHCCRYFGLASVQDDILIVQLGFVFVQSKFTLCYQFLFLKFEIARSNFEVKNMQYQVRMKVDKQHRIFVKAIAIFLKNGHFVSSK